MKFLVKIFDFLDNYIWIGYAKFSPEWKKYFSSTVNVLTNIMKISDLSKRNICRLNSFLIDESKDKIAFAQILALSGICYHIDRQWVFSRRTFQIFT